MGECVNVVIEEGCNETTEVSKRIQDRGLLGYLKIEKGCLTENHNNTVSIHINSD